MLLGAVEQRTRIDTAMLASVRAEMEADSATPAATPRPLAQVEPAPVPAPQIGDVAELLARRDAQVAELRQAVAELAESKPADGHDEWLERIQAIERRLSEQEAAVRHVLTMLIEWFEGEKPRAAA
jgi:hypothetical protein